MQKPHKKVNSLEYLKGQKEIKGVKKLSKEDTFLEREEEEE